MNTKRRFASAGLAGCVIALQAPAIQALDLAYEVSAGAGRSDNIARTQDNEIEETIATGGLRFSLDQRSSRVDANALGDLAYYDYLDDTYDSEFLGNFAGDVRLGLVPERFEWVIADNFGQALVDPFTPVTPDNRENVNVFRTGPDLFIGLGSQTRFKLAGRYAQTDYEDRPLDSQTKVGEAGLVRHFSASSSAGLNARLQKVDYDEALLDSDYEQRDAFLSYQAMGARTDLTLEAGYSRLEREQSEERESGPLFHLDIARKVSAASTVSLRAGREFANASSAFITSQIGGTIGQQPVPGEQTSEPFTNDFVGLNWQFNRNRTSFGLNAWWNDKSYEDAAQFDETLETVGASLGRELSTRTALTLDALYSMGRFDAPQSDYSEWNTGLGFRWRLSESTSVNLTYRYATRSSDALNGDYEENRAFLSFAYGYGTPRSGVSRPVFGVDQMSPASP